MRFFERQAQARRLGRRLLWLFALAVIAIVCAVNAACALVFALLDPWLWAGPGSAAAFAARLPRHFFETNTAVVLLFIVGGSLIEGMRLREGGAAVARMLGAREVGADPASAAERRLRNVAHETAIAAGSPIPALYVLDDEGAINACAAGHDARDAALILTRGALARLGRDELQGVVAHEIAHVLHGDVRLNLRLSAYVFGVLIVFRFGRSLLGYRGNPTGEPRLQGRGGPLAPFAFALGVVIMAVGGIGWVAARMLQAGVGRQREFLADATAVRFTRLPEGLGNALRKAMAQAGDGSGWLSNPAVSPTAHAWMVAPERFQRMFATHPPLPERIRRIFGRTMPALPAPEADPAEGRGQEPRSGGAAQATIEFLAEPRPDTELRAPASWPQQWHLAAAAARRADAATRIALALIAPGETGPLALPGWHASPAFDPGTLEPSSRQALLEIACATLRHEPAAARLALLRQARRLIEGDGRVTLAEFACYLTMADRMGLRERMPRTTLRAPRAGAGGALSVLVRAALQWPGAASPPPSSSLNAALERAARCWGRALPAPPARLATRSLLAAIGSIDALGPLDQALAVKALAAALDEDASLLDPGPGALLRALCSVWGVPLPPRFGAGGPPAAPPQELPALEPTFAD